MSVLKSSLVALSPDHPGIARINQSPPGCIDAANKLLQQNHTKFHIYFRDLAGHNHIAHSVLTVLAMGGGPDDLERAYDDGEGIQREMPPVDSEAVSGMKNPDYFRTRMQQLPEYGNFLSFFEKEVESKGWKAVVSEYCFSHTPLADAMLAQLFEGLYHPIIHLGFGIEFEQPSIVAEGLAQAASHDPSDIDKFFARSDQLSGSVSSRPLIELYAAVRQNEKLRTAARMPDGPHKVRDGVLGRALDDMVAVAAQFQVTHDTLELKIGEMISCAAYSCGAAHKAGKTRKIDFFYMHNVTSSIFLTVLAQQNWISPEDKVRLVEWKGRLDLVWYAASAAAELRLENIANYKPTLSKGMDWAAMYKAVNAQHDDGHVAKFIRALKNGEEVTKALQQGEDAASFPVRGDLWFRIAQIAYDSTAGIAKDIDKWVWGAGFDPMWEKFGNLSSNYSSDFVTAWIGQGLEAKSE